MCFVLQEGAFALVLKSVHYPGEAVCTRYVDLLCCYFWLDDAKMLLYVMTLYINSQFLGGRKALLGHADNVIASSLNGRQVYIVFNMFIIICLFYNINVVLWQV